MSPKTQSARDAAQWLGPESLVLNHVRLANDDLDWMRGVRRLTLLAAKHPPGFLAALPNLEWLDIQGGSARSLSFVESCQGLRCLMVNQVLGLTELSAVEGLAALEYLSIYGQPRIESLPDLAPLIHLERLQLGSLKGLRNGIGPALRAPGLRELSLIRAMALAKDDAALARDHPTLRTFDWFFEDGPRRIVEPVLAIVNKPRTVPLHAWEWFAARAASATREGDFAQLSETTRSTAVVEPSGRVRWPLTMAEPAITELATNGAVIVGLNLWIDQPDLPMEIPFWGYGAGLSHADVTPALQEASAALREHPVLAQHEAPSILVTWVRPEQVEH